MDSPGALTSSEFDKAVSADAHRIDDPVLQNGHLLRRAVGAVNATAIAAVVLSNHKTEQLLAACAHALLRFTVFDPCARSEDSGVLATASHDAGVLAFQAFDQFELINISGVSVSELSVLS